MKPLVLLDVDGVLNLGLFASSKFRARMMFHERDKWHHGWAGERNYGTRIFLRREWGPMVRSIAEAGADLAWATRWEDAANVYIAPLLGLPELPVAPANAWELGDNDELVLAPKAASVVPWAVAQDRPWAWLDDDGTELGIAAEALAQFGKGRPFLPVHIPDRRQGLFPEDVAKVLAWIAEVS